MIQFGEAKNIPELKKLWKKCFADEDAYIDAFFEAMYENENVLVQEENGVLMGASFFLPGNIYWSQPNASGRWQNIRYVYALAVYPQFRGRKIAASLLHKAYEIYGAPLIAEPAEEGLIGGFYKPLGFSETFYLQKKSIEVPQYDVLAAEVMPLQGKSTHIYPVKAEEYCRIRDVYFQNHGYVSWPVRHVAFAIQEHCGSGGGAFAVNRDGREDVVLYYREGQEVIVTETTLTETEIMDIFLPSISGQCSRLIFTSAPDKDYKCSLTGMSYGLSPVFGYLNLSLD